MGNTPTGVGKTSYWEISVQIEEKHPHGRGEDRLHRPGGSAGHRNTPTGVGKTAGPRSGRFPRRKHPHGRGEDFDAGGGDSLLLETPPRAWGRLAVKKEKTTDERNTPTGVGKTAKAGRRRSNFWKHPHGRGEDEKGVSLFALQKETPPRAWGRRPT